MKIRFVVRMFGVAVLMLQSMSAYSARAENIRDIFSDQELRDLFSPDQDLGAAPNPPFVLKASSPNFGGLIGVDVSHHNTDCAVGECSQCKIDWAKLAAMGVKYTFMKASTGKGVVPPDPAFSKYWKELEKFHNDGTIFRGAYHWLISDPNESAEDQATHFLSIVKSTDKQLPPVVDFEEDFVQRTLEFATGNANCKSKRSSSNTIYYVCDGWKEIAPALAAKKLKRWLELVTAASGRRPIIYTRSSYWDNTLGSLGDDLIKTYGIWQARYPNDQVNWHDFAKNEDWKMPPLPKAVKYPPIAGSYTAQHFWQFSESARFENPPIYCDGSPNKSRSMDMNWFPSGIADFKREFKLN